MVHLYMKHVEKTQAGSESPRQVIDVCLLSALKIKTYYTDN